MSRLTFRETQQATCWQKQLRDQYIGEGAPNVDLSLKNGIVRRVSRKTAEQIILKYEWLGTLPSFCTTFYGLFFGSYCAGVTCISIGVIGANINAPMEFNLERQEMAYLVRGANVHWSPQGANSKLVSWTCRLLSKEGIKLIIAYSDTDAGEIGTIYQACNWVYIGLSGITRQWVAPNGRIYDMKYPSDLRQRLGGTRAGWTAKLKSEGWHEQKSNPKHRYVFILDKSDKSLVSLVESKRQSYPKRASEVNGVTGSDQLQEGGSSPTQTLNLS